MLNEKVEAALNEQLNKEIFSAYLYFSMSAWFSSRSLKGFANWMHIQGLEELTHSQKFFDFIVERGGRVRLSDIEAPRVEWDNSMEIYTETLKHEEFVTESINKLVSVARESVDNATEIFLQWFVTEQIEEEGNVNEIIDRLKMAGDNPSALLMLDSEMGKRVFVTIDPAATV
jgi:ferritin